MDALVEAEPLTAEQLAFVEEYLLDALVNMTESDGFVALFGGISADELLKRYEKTFDEQDAPILKGRYQRLQSELNADDHSMMLEKLRGASLFDDLNTDEA
jgi:hypothetical protein